MTDREVLLRWLLGKVRQLIAETRERHPDVLVESDADVISELAVEEWGRDDDG